MEKCKCGSFAINPHLHGRDDSDKGLCDVRYWRKRANSLQQRTKTKMPTLKECQEEIQSRIRAGDLVSTPANITEVVYKFICRHIGCV